MCNSWPMIKHQFKSINQSNKHSINQLIINACHFLLSVNYNSNGDCRKPEKRYHRVWHHFMTHDLIFVLAFLVYSLTKYLLFQKWSKMNNIIRLSILNHILFLLLCGLKYGCICFRPVLAWVDLVAHCGVKICMPSVV